ncbi:TonB C-terminal domain-containing protein [bacterium]|nr:TonB C-terminal domain-containing protein [bacterium]
MSDIFFMKAKQHVPQDRFTQFIILSLIGHTVPLITNWSELFKSKKEEPTFIELQYVAPKPIPIVKKAPPPPPRKEQQLIEQEINKQKEPAPNTDFLGASNQSAEKETHAKKSGEFKNQTDSGYDNLEKDLSADFALNEGEQNSQSSSSQSNDYLKDIEEGMKTVVNTKEFVYFSYYSKIRAAIQKQWKKNVREHVKIIYRDSRDIAGTDPKVTRVSLRLSKTGSLESLEVLRDSGNNTLDQAVLSAFRQAQPFPPPPDGILESDGTIHIRWDFILD